MPLFARFVFGILDFASRKGLAEAAGIRADDSAGAGKHSKKKARETGIQGETYAYWYLRRQGYVMVAQNYKTSGIRGEIDMVGYDGEVLAFVEVKTRTRSQNALAKPEDAVTHEKRTNISRMARRFLSERRVAPAQCRFDILAIETQPGKRPEVRLHKGAFFQAS